MPDQRKSQRIPQQFRVFFGEGDFRHEALTGNISRGGAFIATDQYAAPGTHLHLKLLDADGRWAGFECEARWLRTVPPGVRGKMQPGIGVRFLGPDELVDRFFPILSVDEEVAITFETRDDLRAAFDRELRRGSILVPTPLEFEADEQVMLELRLPFARKVLRFPARVLPVAEMRPGARGVALGFIDKDRAVAEIGRHLDPAAR